MVVMKGLEPKHICGEDEPDGIKLESAKLLIQKVENLNKFPTVASNNPIGNNNLKEYILYSKLPEIEGTGKSTL